MPSPPLTPTARRAQVSPSTAAPAAIDGPASSPALDPTIATAIDGALDREMALRALALSSKRMRTRDRSLSDEVA